MNSCGSGFNKIERIRFSKKKPDADPTFNKNWIPIRPFESKTDPDPQNPDTKQFFKKSGSRSTTLISGKAGERWRLQKKRFSFLSFFFGKS